MNEHIEIVRTLLKDGSSEETKASVQHFFKEDVKTYGLKMPQVNKIANEHFKKLKSLSKDEVFDLCEAFWQSGILEESLLACRWSYALRKDYKPGDFVRFKKWIAFYVNNWASCDTFCNHTMGEFLKMYPEYISELKSFTSSQNRWMRRAAAVSLIIPAREGLFHDSIFEIAESLLSDSDDLVQKGYGWMLKSASQFSEQEVFAFVMKHKYNMPRTALRYAIEKMPKEMRVQAMSKTK